MTSTPRIMLPMSHAQLYHSAARKFGHFRSMRGAKKADEIRARFITPPRRRIADLPPDELASFIAALEAK